MYIILSLFILFFRLRIDCRRFFSFFFFDFVPPSIFYAFARDMRDPIRDQSPRSPRDTGPFRGSLTRDCSPSSGVARIKETRIRDVGGYR